MHLSKSIILITMIFVLGCGQPGNSSDQSTKSNQTESKQTESNQNQDSTANKVPADPEKATALLDQAEQMSQKNEGFFQPFYVYSNKGARTNHFIPSGFMPDGKCVTFNDAWQDDCQNGHTCIKVEYDVECSRNGEKWAGIYWLNPANNWGQRKGGYNLSGASKLTFWAKGQLGGEQIQEITVGGITGNYPDSDIVVIGPIILTNKWKEYTVDLRGKDLSYISGGFSWTTSEEVNLEDCVFYLDEIRYE
ncbi:MAG: hypothetical protein KC713_02205 [Candidatus Omnitrophica bacterium]|nr:hypothetical protein [Candidatus Omnitrophota bacterium]